MAREFTWRVDKAVGGKAARPATVNVLVSPQGVTISTGVTTLYLTAVQSLRLAESIAEAQS